MSYKDAYIITLQKYIHYSPSADLEIVSVCQIPPVITSLCNSPQSGHVTGSRSRKPGMSSDIALNSHLHDVQVPVKDFMLSYGIL